MRKRQKTKTKTEKKNTWGSYSTFPTRFRVFVNYYYLSLSNICLYLLFSYLDLDVFVFIIFFLNMLNC